MYCAQYIDVQYQYILYNSLYIGMRLGIYNKLYANSFMIAITFDHGNNSVVHYIRFGGNDREKSLSSVYPYYTNTSIYLCTQ